MPAVDSSAGSDVATGSSSSAATPDPVDMGELRDLVLKANPDVIPEMIAGDTFDTLMASVDPAKAAYQRIVQSVGGAAGGGAAAVARVPAGGGATRQFVVNIEELSPSAKIAEGLRQRQRKS